MATAPNFASGSRQAMAQVITANNNRDGTGTTVNLITAGANGTRLDKIMMYCTGTSTAGMLRFFMYDGTNTRLYQEQIVAAVSGSNTVPGWQMTLVYGDYSPFLIPSGSSIKVATANNEAYNILAFGADY